MLTRLRKALAEPVEIGGLPLAVEASVGFAMAPQDGLDAGQLMQRADVAMYVAKDQHLGVGRYPPISDHYSVGRAATGRRTRRRDRAGPAGAALPAEGRPRTGEITSVEALVRWNHPTRGLLYPDAFLPAVEQTELIEPLTWWVLRNATLALARSIRAGGSRWR